MQQEVNMWDLGTEVSNSEDRKNYSVINHESLWKRMNYVLSISSDQSNLHRKLLNLNIYGIIQRELI